MSFSMPTILPTMMTIRSYGKRVTCRGLPEDFHGNENGAVREIVNQNSMKRALVPFKSGWTSVTYGGNFIGTYFCGMVYPIKRKYDQNAYLHFSCREPYVKRGLQDVLSSRWMYRICNLLLTQPEWVCDHPLTIASGLMTYMDTLSCDVTLRKTQKDLSYFWTRLVVPYVFDARYREDAPFILVRRNPDKEDPKKHIFFGFKFTSPEN